MFANDLQITFHSSFQPKLAKISALKYIINYRISLKIPPALMARLCRSRFEQRLGVQIPVATYVGMYEKGIDIPKAKRSTSEFILSQLKLFKRANKTNKFRQKMLSKTATQNLQRVCNKNKDVFWMHNMFHCI